MSRVGSSSPRSATIRDVALRAGVNVSTVSRVISPTGVTPRISQDTTRRVRRAALALRYQPNSAARALRLQKSRNLGLLISDTTFFAGLAASPVSALTFAHIEEACAARGYSLQLMRLDSANPAAALARIGSRPIDGLVFMGVEDPRVVERCRQLGLPAVEIHASGNGAEVCEVEADLIEGRCEALRYAASLGHRRMAIARLGHPRQRRLYDAVVGRARLDPQLAACRLSAIDIPPHSAGATLMQGWQEHPSAERPTVVLAHEHLLVSFLGELGRAGLRCPRDVSLVGLSGTMLAESLQPALTVIDNQIELVARSAVSLLIDHVEAERLLTPADAPRPVPCRFIIRDSCAAPSAGHDFQ